MTIINPHDAAVAIEHYKDRKTEAFGLIHINSDMEIIAVTVIAGGGAKSCVILKRIAFKEAILKESAAVVLFHNHPSGNLKPSEEDLITTRELSAAGDVIGIKVLDHIIIGKSGYYSFLEHQLIKQS